MRDSFIFYRSFYEAAQDLEDADRLKFYDAVLEYALNGSETLTERSSARAVFKSVRPQIDVNNQRYENGKKGGAPLGNKNAKKQPKTTKKQPKHNQSTTKKQPNVNVNVNDNENDKYKSPLDIALDNFKDHRKQLKAPMTDQAYKMLLNKLEKLSGGDEEKKVAILNQSIENGWKGVFDIKSGEFKTKKGGKRDDITKEQRESYEQFVF